MKRGERCLKQPGNLPSSQREFCLLHWRSSSESGNSFSETVLFPPQDCISTALFSHFKKITQIELMRKKVVGKHNTVEVPFYKFVCLLVCLFLKVVLAKEMEMCQNQIFFVIFVLVLVLLLYIRVSLLRTAKFNVAMESSGVKY